MTTVYLALGSNVGDRLAHLRAAVAQLEARGVRVEKKSRLYKSQSVGSGGEGDFLNAVVGCQTDLTAPALLALCQEIELREGRKKPRHEGVKREGSRALDLDILLFGHETWNTTALQIPHPRALERPFVLRPLLDVLEGGWVGETALEW